MILQPDILFHDRYLLREIKGRGTFGEVWLAKDTKLDIDVAVKVYIALDTRGVEEFKSEYKTAFGLNHPNLLHAHHFDICQDRPYLVMPYCPNSAMGLIGKIDEPTIWRFIRDVSSGLDYLHGMGIIHHDIKPDNIMMDSDGKFLITDFGISVKFRSTLRRNSARQVQSKTIGGSIPYMAPELFAEQAEAVNASDIWALGATIYEMLTGELPFFGQGGAMQQNGAKVPDVPGNWSEDLKKVVKICLAFESWNRPSAQQLADYSKMALEGKKVVFKDKKSPKKVLKPSIVVASAIAVAFVLFIVLHKKQEPIPKEAPAQMEENVIQEHEKVYSLPSGKTYTYNGDQDSLGIPNGHGIAIFDDFIYEGMFNNGNMEGFGKLSYTKGDWKGRVYSGYFSDNQIDSGWLESGKFKFNGLFKDMEYWNGIMCNDDGETFSVVEGEMEFN